MDRKYFKLFPLILILQILASIVINQIYLLSNNTLEDNGNWIVMKKQVQMPLLGAQNYFSDKVALRQSKLNLSAWHGFQGVLYKNQIDPEKIEFDFYLTDDSYFYFIFNKNTDLFSGLRMSANKTFSNVLVTAHSDGEFIKKINVKLKAPEKNRWNRLTVIFNSSKYSIFINNKLIGNFSENYLTNQHFGFRGSYKPVYIDNVFVKRKGSDEIFKESFFNRKNQIESGILFFSIIIVISLIVGLFQVLRKHDIKKVAFSLILLNMLFLLISLPTLFVYYYVNEIKTNYPRIHGIYRFYRNLMKEERNFVRRDTEFVNERLMEDYNYEASKNVNRILFIGTSQTRGAGAASKNETIVRVTEDILNQAGTGRYECINAGVHGTRSNALVRYYENNWIKLRPKITAINLSSNDNDIEVFRSSMQRFVDLNKSKGIETVFILEANSIEVITDLQDFHSIMKEIGNANNILIIDLHNYLLEKYDSGILWWDGVHMTSYGQRISAEFIAEKILTYFRDL